MDVSALTSSIRRGECILVVGPELAPEPGKPPLHKAFRTHAPTLHAPGILIYDQDSLMSFEDDNTEFDYAEGWVTFCEQQSAGQVFMQISQIPFPLVISLATDGQTEAAFEKTHGAKTGLLPVGLARVKDTFRDKPSQEHPVVVSLLGNVRKSQHMVLTHSQMLDFLFNLLESGREKALPEPIQEVIGDAKRVLFVGCNLQAWYMQVMMRLLGLGSREERDRRRKPSSDKHPALTGADEAFFRKQFRMEFMEDQPHATLAALAKAFSGDEAAAPDQHPVLAAVNASVARGELRDALRQLAEYFRESPETLQDVTLLRGRLSTLQEDIADGVISAENASIERNRLMRSILTLAETIQ